MHGTLAWPFVNGKPVELWSNFAVSQVSNEWQVSQVVGKLAEAWLGFVVFW
jgi:hypothetical protein